MNSPVPVHENNAPIPRESLLFKEFLAEREEILRHKWLESEKAGYATLASRKRSLIG